MVFCKDCVYFSDNFLGEKCTHKDCFEYVSIVSPVKQITGNIRVLDYAKLNATNECRRFEKYVWYRHW